jgi:hypothetical protein
MLYVLVGAIFASKHVNSVMFFGYICFVSMTIVNLDLSLHMLVRSKFNY